jgi:hypothetical protein
MNDAKHLWVVVGGEHEVIIDREYGDVRVRIGNNIVKVQFSGNELKRVLVDDVHCYP